MKKLFWFIATIVIGFKLACLIIDWQANIAYKREIAKSTAAVTDISEIFKNVQFNDSKDKSQISNDEYQKANRSSSKTTTSNEVPAPVSQFRAGRKEDEAEVKKLNERLRRIANSVEEAKKVAQDENENPYLRQVALFVLGWKKEKGGIPAIIFSLKNTDFEIRESAARAAYNLGVSGNLSKVERMWLLTALIEAFNDKRYNTKKRWICEAGIVKIKINIAKAICCVGYKVPSFDVIPYVNYIIDRIEDERFKDEPSIVLVATQALGDLGFVGAIPALKRAYKKYRKDEARAGDIRSTIWRIRIKYLTRGRIDIGG